MRSLVFAAGLVFAPFCGSISAFAQDEASKGSGIGLYGKLAVGASFTDSLDQSLTYEGITDFSALPTGHSVNSDTALSFGGALDSNIQVAFAQNSKFD